MLPLLSLLHCSLLIFFSTYNGNDHFVTFVPFLVFVIHLDVNMVKKCCNKELKKHYFPLFFFKICVNKCCFLPVIILLHDLTSHIVLEQKADI